MAALNAIARDWATELRNGIAWLIVWKTGRNWNAEPVYLDDDGLFEPEDRERAYEILKQDPNAVMINGDDCNHFDEDMPVAELAAGIRWHYDKGSYPLAISDAFPNELEPRPEGLPADLPWYGRSTTEASDPYVYDGGMSLKDYERMTANLITETEEPEPTQANEPVAESTQVEQTAPEPIPAYQAVTNAKPLDGRCTLGVVAFPAIEPLAEKWKPP